MINKVVVGPGSPFAERPFVFDVNCTLGGNAQPTVTVSLASPATSVTVPGLSTGAECTVTETNAGGADAPAAVEPTSVVIGAADQPAVTVTGTNTFSVGHVQVAKVLDGPGALFAAGRMFTVQVVCQRPTATGFAEVLRQSVSVTAAAPVTVAGDLPIGSAVPGGRRPTATAPHRRRWTSADPGCWLVVTLVSPTITITATNTFTLGSMVITKVLDGPGASSRDLAAWLGFQVLCTFGASVLLPRR